MSATFPKRRDPSHIRIVIEQLPTSSQMNEPAIRNKASFPNASRKSHPLSVHLCPPQADARRTQSSWSERAKKGKQVQEQPVEAATMCVCHRVASFSQRLLGAKQQSRAAEFPFARPRPTLKDTAPKLLQQHQPLEAVTSGQSRGHGSFNADQRQCVPVETAWGCLAIGTPDPLRGRSGPRNAQALQVHKLPVRQNQNQTCTVKPPPSRTRRT